MTTDRLVPFCLFTDPELARVGLSEKEARARGIKYRLFRIPMAADLRTRTLSETRGFMKALVAEGSDQILGFTVVGVDAGETMSAMQLAMIGNLPYTAVRDAVMTHPTLMEALVKRIADGYTTKSTGARFHRPKLAGGVRGGERYIRGMVTFSSLRALAALAALTLAAPATMLGCLDEDYGPETEADVAYEGYQPAYYDGYVVYYDGVGRPYYYDRGVVVWIAPESPYYPGLIHHYHVYGGYYGGWYTHYGYRYRGYRYAPGHYAYHGYSHGGPRYRHHR